MVELTGQPVRGPRLLIGRMGYPGNIIRNAVGQTRCQPSDVITLVWSPQVIKGF